MSRTVCGGAAVPGSVFKVQRSAGHEVLWHMPDRSLNRQTRNRATTLNLEPRTLNVQISCSYSPTIDLSTFVIFGQSSGYGACLEFSDRYCSYLHPFRGVA